MSTSNLNGEKEKSKLLTTLGKSLLLKSKVAGYKQTKETS